MVLGFLGGGSFSVFKRLCQCFFRAASAFCAFFYAALSYNGYSRISSSFADFGVLDSLAALQGPFLYFCKSCAGLDSLCYCISCFIFSALAGRFVSNF